MVNLAVYDSQGKNVAGKDFRQGGKMAKNGFFSGLKFYADVKRSSVRYHCFFRGREHSGGRSEQYFVEYEGDLEGFRDLASQVKKAMRDAHEDFEFAKNAEDDFLWDLVGVQEYTRCDPNKISSALKNNNRIEFLARSHRSAASLVDFLMDVETHSRDEHATIGVADNFRDIDEPEIAIKLDSSADGVEGPKIDNGRSSNTSSTQSYGKRPGADKPSGPGEWIKSKIPFV